MAGIKDAPAHAPRRGPVPHSEAVQEAKRREKMQTVCSSHRVSGTAERPAPLGEAAKG
jgi:hypothetical protein